MALTFWTCLLGKKHNGEGESSYRCWDRCLINGSLLELSIQGQILQSYDQRGKTVKSRCQFLIKTELCTSLSAQCYVQRALEYFCCLKGGSQQLKVAHLVWYIAFLCFFLLTQLIKFKILLTHWYVHGLWILKKPFVWHLATSWHLARALTFKKKEKIRKWKTFYQSHSWRYNPDYCLLAWAKKISKKNNKWTWSR